MTTNNNYNNDDDMDENTRLRMEVAEVLHDGLDVVEDSATAVNCVQQTMDELGVTQQTVEFEGQWGIVRVSYSPYLRK